jgi:hypothetical protein
MHTRAVVAFSPAPGARLSGVCGIGHLVLASADDANDVARISHGGAWGVGFWRAREPGRETTLRPATGRKAG